MSTEQQQAAPLVSEVSYCGVVPELCAPLSGPKLAAQRVAASRNKDGGSAAAAAAKSDAPKLRAAASDALTNRVWTADDSGTLCLRDGHTGEAIIPTAAASNDTNTAAANALLWVKAQNNVWAAFTTGNIVVFDATTGESVTVLRTGGDGAMCLTESRCGRYVFCGGVSGSVMAFTCTAGRIARVGTWTEHAEGALVLSVASSSRSAEFGFIASGGSDGSVLLWEPEDDEDAILNNNSSGGKGGSPPVSLTVVRNFSSAAELEQNEQDAAVLALLCVEVALPVVKEDNNNNAADTSIAEINSAKKKARTTPTKNTATASGTGGTPINKQRSSGARASTNSTPDVSLIEEQQQQRKQQQQQQHQEYEEDVTPFVWVGNAGGRVRVWNCATGEMASDTQLHEHSVSHLFTSGGRSDCRVWSSGLDGKVFGIDARTFAVQCVIQQPAGVQCVVPVAAAAAWRLWACTVDGSARAYLYQVDDDKVGAALLGGGGAASDSDDNNSSLVDAMKRKQQEHDAALQIAQREALDAERRNAQQAQQQQHIISELRDELIQLTDDYDKQMVAMQDEITRLRSDSANNKAQAFLKQQQQQTTPGSSPVPSLAQQHLSPSRNSQHGSSPRDRQQSPIHVISSSALAIESDIVLAELEDTELFSRLQMTALECDDRENILLMLQSIIFAEVRRSMSGMTPVKHRDPQQQQQSVFNSPKSTPTRSGAGAGAARTAGGRTAERDAAFRNDLEDLNIRLADRDNEIEALRGLLESERKRAERELSTVRLSLQQEGASQKRSFETQLLEAERLARQHEGALREAQLELNTLRARDKGRSDSVSDMNHRVDELEGLYRATLEREAAAHERAEKLVAELDDSRKQLAARSAKADSALESSAALRERCDNLESDLQKMADAAAEQQKQAEEDRRELEERNERLQRDLLAMRGPWESMKSALRESHASLEELKGEFGSLERDLAWESKENEKLRAQLASMGYQQQGAQQTAERFGALYGGVGDRARPSQQQQQQQQQSDVAVGSGGAPLSRNASPSVPRSARVDAVPQYQQQQQQQTSSSASSRPASQQQHQFDMMASVPSAPSSRSASGSTSAVSSHYNHTQHQQHHLQEQRQSSASSQGQQQQQQNYAPGSLPRALDAVIERFSSLPR